MSGNALSRYHHRTAQDRTAGVAVSPSRSAQTADIDKAAVSKLIRRNSFYSQRGMVTLAGFLIDGEVCGSPVWVDWKGPSVIGGFQQSRHDDSNPSDSWQASGGFQHESSGDGPDSRPYTKESPT